MNNRTGKAVIPLQCTLCPKSPQFSDISHLLTHISSKGHLSHRFKLQIRCQGDPAARIQLEAYEIWYADNGLAELLSERLQSKEQKNTKRTRANKSQGTQSRATKGKGKKVNLAQPVKYEIEDPELRRPLTPSRFKMPVPVPAPRMAMWNTQPLTMGSPFEPNQSTRWVERDVYATPTARRYVPHFIENGSSEEDGRTQMSSPIKGGHELGELQDDTGGDNSKLKGILWQGMGLFDSATAEMKRMRNQKKDGSILARMKSTSREVVPEEVVYNTQGEVQRVKDIYETSPENSPVSSSKTSHESFEKKQQQPRRVRKPKAMPLKSIDVNIPMSQSYQRGKHSTRDTTMSRSSYDGADDYRPYNSFAMDRTLKRNAHDDEFALTAGNYGKKQKLGVYRDAEEPSPGRTESPLGEHRFDYLPPIPVDPPAPSRLPHFSPPPLQRPGSLRLYGGKENMHSDYHPHRPIASESFPPHAFHTQNHNPLFSYNHSYTYSSYGYDSPAPAYQNEMRRAQPFMSSGEFKPLMMPSPYKDPTPAPPPPHPESTGFTNPFYLGM